MPRYCVNKNAQNNGDHEVHKEGCQWWPAPNHVLDLGIHTSCTTAVAKAKQTYPQSNGCAYCSPACNTG